MAERFLPPINTRSPRFIPMLFRHMDETCQVHSVQRTDNGGDVVGGEETSLSGAVPSRHLLASVHCTALPGQTDGLRTRKT